MSDKSASHDDYLSKEQQSRLLAIAREALSAAVQGRMCDIHTRVDGPLSEPGAAFVTLMMDGDLRGCIGYTEAVIPLYKCVCECAASAALRDPRFTPVTPEELSRIEIDISVLTPLEEVSDISEIEVGRDGLVISHHGRKGLLLPQVATEYGWNSEQFLAQTCRKAGLPADAWKMGAKIYKFSAQVFGES